MSQRTAHVFWCDDIRQEVGNKPSLMGVYVDGINVPTLPMQLPKISAWLAIKAPASRPVKKWSVQLVMNDTTTLMEMPETEVPASTRPPPKPGATRVQQTIAMAITAGPIELPADCQHLQLLVTADGKRLETSRLMVYKAGG